MLYTVTSVFKYNYRIRGSKFLGILNPVISREEAEKQLVDIKSEHPAATHHCYGFIINPIEPDEMAADDGEPAGSAGLPILNALRSYGMMNVILIVVRYFGGTKLGKTGLIEAYKETAIGTIKKAKLKKLITVKTYRILYDYSQQGLIDKIKHDFPVIELSASYFEHIELYIGCPLNISEQFELALSGKEHLFREIVRLEDTVYINH